MRYLAALSLALILTVAAGPRLYAAENDAAIPQVSAAENDIAVRFVTDLGDNAIQMLINDTLDQNQRLDEFRRLLVVGFDIPLISRYVLGRYWRRASPEERNEYLHLFEEFLVRTYAARLGQYGGETLEIKTARTDGDRDVIVRSEIIPSDGPAVRVDWRVRNFDGNYRIIDVVVEGISMIITQRDEFAAVIESSGGRVEGLLAELRSRTQ